MKMCTTSALKLVIPVNFRWMFASQPMSQQDAFVHVLGFGGHS